MFHHIMQYLMIVAVIASLISSALDRRAAAAAAAESLVPAAASSSSSSSGASVDVTPEVTMLQIDKANGAIQPVLDLDLDLDLGLTAGSSLIASSPLVSTAHNNINRAFPDAGLMADEDTMLRNGADDDGSTTYFTNIGVSRGALLMRRMSQLLHQAENDKAHRQDVANNKPNSAPASDADASASAASDPSAMSVKDEASMMHLVDETNNNNNNNDNNNMGLMGDDAARFSIDSSLASNKHAILMNDADAAGDEGSASAGTKSSSSSWTGSASATPRLFLVNQQQQQPASALEMKVAAGGGGGGGRGGGRVTPTTYSASSAAAAADAAEDSVASDLQDPVVLAEEDMPGHALMKIMETFKEKYEKEEDTPSTSTVHPRCTTRSCPS